MLISFRFANFLSFREEANFTMIASREHQHKQSLIPVPEFNLKLLPAAAIYGANGSGKSNFYRALEFVEQMVLSPTVSPEDQINVEPFRLDEETQNSPSRFFFEILIKNEVFKYSFCLTHRRILTESLEILRGTKNILVYRREATDHKDVWNLDFFKKLELPQDEKDFIAFKARDTLPNQLFLNAAQGRKIPLVESLAMWFKKTLILIDPKTVVQSIVFAQKERNQLRGFCAEALSKAHTGIDKIEGEEISLDVVDLPLKIKEDIKAKMAKDSVAQVVSRDNKRYSVFIEDDKLKCIQLVTYHRNSKGGQTRFDVSEESEGTQRFIDLLPAFHDLLREDEDKVYVIDELDRSLHTLLTRNLIEDYVSSRTSTSRGQLIFTTHDGLLLDQSILRRDEFWFIDKNLDGSSSLNSLSDFRDVRYDKDIRKSYLSGRFGGIPIIRKSFRKTPESV